jgi:anti-sigma B factor antagonist
MSGRLLHGVFRRRTTHVATVPQVPTAAAGSNLSMTQLPAGSDGVRLCLAGDIDLSGRDSLRNRILAIIDIEQVKHLVVDLDQVEFLDCGGVGVLVKGRTAADGMGCRYEVHNPRGYVATVLRAAGVWVLLSVNSAPASTRSTTPLPQ